MNLFFFVVNSSCPGRCSCSMDSTAVEISITSSSCASRSGAGTLESWTCVFFRFSLSFGGALSIHRTDGLRKGPVPSSEMQKAGHTASPSDRTCLDQSWKLRANFSKMDTDSEHVRTPGCLENERNSMLLHIEFCDVSRKWPALQPEFTAGHQTEENNRKNQVRNLKKKF